MIGILRPGRPLRDALVRRLTPARGRPAAPPIVLEVRDVKVAVCGCVTVELVDVTSLPGAPVTVGFGHDERMASR
jgi:hypothetical protein